MKCRAALGAQPAGSPSEHSGVLPDILTVAKGIASGLPLSGVFSRLDLMKRWPTGSHGGTYGGNAVAMAAGVATIRAMKEERMLENAAARGQQPANRPAKTSGRVPAHRRCARFGADDWLGISGGRQLQKSQRPGQEGHPRRRRARAAPALLRHLRSHHPLDSAAQRHRSAGGRSLADIPKPPCGKG